MSESFSVPYDTIVQGFLEIVSTDWLKICKSCRRQDYAKIICRRCHKTAKAD